jgi:hypothetical protein
LRQIGFGKWFRPMFGPRIMWRRRGKQRTAPALLDAMQMAVTQMVRRAVPRLSVVPDPPSRLCSSAVDAQILLDPVLVNEIRTMIKVKDLGEIDIKGYDKPIQVCAVA